MSKEHGRTTGPGRAKKNPFEQLASKGRDYYGKVLSDMMRDYVGRYGENALAEVILNGGLQVAACSEASVLKNDKLTGLIGTLMLARDPYTAKHQRRVASLSKGIAKKLGLASRNVNVIELSAAMHDIGKLRVPSEILSKPDRLDDAEMALLRTHSRTGRDILQSAGIPFNIPAIVLSHHERLDGSGYPDGLKGDQIPVESQVISVADVLEAVASHRPYRPGKGLRQALDTIEKNRGTHYHCDIVDAAIYFASSLEGTRVLNS